MWERYQLDCGLDERLEVTRGAVAAPVEVAMNGATYLADLTGGQKTGLFYDQRPNHAFAAGLARGVDVLDVFSHVGGFALAALAGGARAAQEPLDAGQLEARAEWVGEAEVTAREVRWAGDRSGRKSTRTTGSWARGPQPVPGYERAREWPFRRPVGAPSAASADWVSPPDGGASARASGAGSGPTRFIPTCWTKATRGSRAMERAVARSMVAEKPAIAAR